MTSTFAKTIFLAAGLALAAGQAQALVVHVPKSAIMAAMTTASVPSDPAPSRAAALPIRVVATLLASPAQLLTGWRTSAPTTTVVAAEPVGPTFVAL